MAQRRLVTWEVSGRNLELETAAGVFSRDEVDPGSRLLVREVLSAVRPHQHILDLGTGSGVIGLALASSVPRGEIWMVDVDLRAVRLAEGNARRNGVENAKVMLSDGAKDLPGGVSFDLVVSNPPTHDGREVLEILIADAHRVLKPGGSLWLVVNRLLSVRAMMAAVFGDCALVTREKGYLVFRAEKARRRTGE